MKNLVINKNTTRYQKQQFIIENTALKMKDVFTLSNTALNDQVRTINSKNMTTENQDLQEDETAYESTEPLTAEEQAQIDAAETNAPKVAKTKKVKVEKAPKEPKEPKEPKAPKQPKVPALSSIGAIKDAILNAPEGGITKGEIHEKLISLFPDRTPKDLMCMIMFQLNSHNRMKERLEKEGKTLVSEEKEKIEYFSIA